MGADKELKLRFIILNGLIIILGMVFVLKLFDLQILKGENYRNTSQSRLFREASVEAPRGEIYDRNGLLLATNREAFSVEIIPTPIEQEKLNRVILSMIRIFERNGDSYKDNFPMNINPVKLQMKAEQDSDKQKIIKFKQQFKIKNMNISDQELFNQIRKYFKIPDDFSVEDARKVMAVRYEMKQQPLSQFDPVELAVDVSKQTVAELEERHIDFPGVSIVVKPIREYPGGTLAAHIIGYMGKINQEEFKDRKDKGYGYDDVIGKDGLESTMEDFLKGKDGLRKVEMDSMGRLTGEIGGTTPTPGNNVYLTIDLNLQKVAEKSLKETIEKINSGGYADKFEDAQSGAVVAMDVKTGDVLAMVSYPSYDPSIFVKGVSVNDWNQLMDNEEKPLFDRVIKGIYSPGSTFKMVTAMAALQEGKVTPDEKILDEGRYTRYRDYQPRCWLWTGQHRTHGYINISEAIKVSCNYFFYEMGYRTGINNLNKYVKMFGLGSKTGIELPGEKNGIIAGPEYRASLKEKGIKAYDWQAGNTLSAAIGQSDYSFTPIQMANYIATLADGEVRNKPNLISKVTTWKGENLDPNKVRELIAARIGDAVNNVPEKLNLEKRNVDAILSGMESVTGDAGGTAYGTFADFPIKVGGKTGTVQVPGYHPNGKKRSDHAWFVGFAPFDNPEIAVAVLIENGGHGAYTAPVAKDIMAQYFGLYKDNTEAENQGGNTSTNAKNTGTQGSSTTSPGSAGGNTQNGTTENSSQGQEKDRPPGRKNDPGTDTAEPTQNPAEENPKTGNTDVHNQEEPQVEEQPDSSGNQEQNGPIIPDNSGTGDEKLENPNQVAQ